MGKQVTSGQVIVSTQVTVKAYTLGRLSSETVYTDDTRTTKVTQTVYSYTGSQATSITKTTYAADGVTIVSVETTSLFQDNSANTTVEKRS